MWFESSFLNAVVLLAPVFFVMWLDSWAAKSASKK